MTNTGKEFERAIAELLGHLGALDVKRDVRIDDSQIDVVGSIEVFGRRLQLIVECKDFESALPLDVVEKTLAKFRSLTAHARSDTILMLVTRNGLTQSGHGKCERLGVLDFSYNDLESQLVNPRQHLTKMLAELEQTPFERLRMYRPLTVDVLAGFLPTDTPLTFDSAFDRWLNAAAASPILVLLGDYGDGKTTSCNQAFAQAARRHLNGGSIRSPLFFHLSEFQVTGDLSRFVVSTLIEKWGVPVRNFHAFNVANSKGRLLLFFDGFDEMDPGKGRLNIVRNFKQFEAVATPGSKVVISCRNTYFVADYELESFLRKTNLLEYCKAQSLDVIRLNQFSVDAALAYLAHHPKVDESSFEAVKRNEKLLPLLRKPIIAEMVAQNMGDGKVSRIEHLVQIYEYCLDRWLDRDDWKSNLMAAERKSFCIHLADQLREDNAPSFGFDKLQDLVDRKFQRYSPEIAKVYGSDIMNCTFFTRSADGQFSFFHKSIGEYLAALRLVQRLEGYEMMSSGSSTVDWTDAKNASVELISFAVQIIEVGVLKRRYSQERRERLFEILAHIIAAGMGGQASLLTQIRDYESPYLRQLKNLLLPAIQKFVADRFGGA